MELHKIKRPTDLSMGRLGSFHVRRFKPEGERWSCGPNVVGRWPFRSLGHLVLNPLSLGQRSEPIHLDGGVMDENVLRAVFGRNESKTLRIVEPLHGTNRHGLPRSHSRPFGEIQPKVDFVDLRDGEPVWDTRRSNRVLFWMAQSKSRRTGRIVTDVPAGENGGTPRCSRSVTATSSTTRLVGQPAASFRSRRRSPAVVPRGAAHSVVPSNAPLGDAEL